MSTRSFQMNTFITPPPALRLREDVTTTSSTSSTSYSTAANGCVICPNNVGTCPQCPTGEECTLTSQTCYTCPKYRCVAISSSGSISGSAVGGIVGGVLGGLVALSLGLLLYYTLVYRKKHPRLSDDSDGYDSEYEMESQMAATEGGDASLYTEQSEKLERPVSQRKTSSSSIPAPKNRRLSSYESFMRPPGYTKNKRGGARAGPRTRGGPGAPRRGPGSTAPGTLSYAGSDMLSKRDSVATTISTTNASNILPIAYIPGVTIRPTKNNTRSIFSYDNESVFTDYTGIDNASIIQERSDGNGKNTMTAVRVQPKLVNVTRIDEDIAEEDEEEEEEIEVELDRRGEHHAEAQRDYVQNATPFWADGHSGSAHEARSDSDSDSDSDVDSDIGEIKRATSTRKSPGTRSVFDDVASGHSSDEFDSQEEEDHHGSKSFVLDIGRES